MKTVTLTRMPTTDEGTFSDFHFGDLKLFATELPWRDNVTGQSCIPTGSYQCLIVDSPKFGKVYGVQNVPGRSAILIHAANFGGDTSKGFTCELLGCIAPCMAIGYLNNHTGESQRAGLSSKLALGKFMQWANGEDLTLIIT